MHPLWLSGFLQSKLICTSETNNKAVAGALIDVGVCKLHATSVILLVRLLTCEINGVSQVPVSCIRDQGSEQGGVISVIFTAIKEFLTNADGRKAIKL